MSDTIKELPNIHQPDQDDLYQGHSNNRHFQWTPQVNTVNQLNFAAIKFCGFDAQTPWLLFNFAKTDYCKHEVAIGCHLNDIFILAFSEIFMCVCKR